MQQLGAESNRTGSAVTSMSGQMKASATVMRAAMGGAAALIARDLFNAASDMQESINKTDQVFKSSSGTIKAWADDAARNLGMSEQAALEASGTFGNLFTSMGFTRGAAADMSMSVVQLAADLGSFNNIGTDAALEKIRAGLVGEIEPLRSLGVNLTAAAVQAKALEMGLADNAKALTAADKAQASYALILEQTTNAQGDFARNADGAANSLKTAQASIDDVKASLGAGLVPIVAIAAQQVTDMAEAVGILTDSLNGLVGSIPGVNGELVSFSSILTASNPILSGFTGMMDLLNDQFGETESKGAPVGAFFKGVAAQLVDVQAEAEETYDLLLGIQNLMSDRDKGQVGGSGNTAQKQYNDALARSAELAGIANERNSEMFHTIELGSGAVAQAAFDLAKLATAADAAWQGQQNLNAQWTAAQDAVGFWETNLKNAESALDILSTTQEKNGSLTEEQQRQYDLLTWAQERYKGGVEDSEGAVVDAAVAQAEFIKRQDELNDLLDRGKIKPAEYAREMANLTAETDPATSASYNMAAAQNDLMAAFDASVNKLGNLLIDLGLLPESKRTEFTTPGMEDAQRDVDTLHGKVNDVPGSMTIDVYVNMAAAQNALNELRGMTFTQSPPKKGPMAFVPDWSYLFEGLVKDAENYGKQAMERLSAFVTGIDLNDIADRQIGLQGDIANLTAVRDAMAEIGDADAVAQLNAEIERLSTEAANLAGIVGTDAVQAWLRNENAMKAQAEQAERVREVQEQIAQATQTAVMVLSEGGNAASSYFERITGAYEDARDALDMAQLLGLPAEVIDGLQKDFDDASNVMTAGAEQLQAALLAGLLDEETLAALAEAGGEWFRQLYDNLFGEGALAEVQAGWNQISEESLAALAELIPQMGDGASKALDSVVEAILSGAVSYEEALGVLGTATGKQVDGMVAELERLEAALIVQLAEALIAGTDPTGIERNIEIIRQLLGDLADSATYTGRVVSAAITGAEIGSGSGPGSGSAYRYSGSGVNYMPTPGVATHHHLDGSVTIMKNGVDTGVAYGSAGSGTSNAAIQASVSDGMVDGHRRIITGSRRSTTLVRS